MQNGKVVPYSSRHTTVSQFLGSQPPGDISHKPNGRLPLLSTSQRDYLPWPVPNYTAWWQRHADVCSLPKAIMQWCPARTWTCDL